MMIDSPPGATSATAVHIDELQLLENDSLAFSNLSGNIDSSRNASGGRRDEKRTDGATRSSNTENYDTLDEPVIDTIKRDLKAIGSKFTHVLYPRTSQTLLRDWDLWGPLFLCVFIALFLQEHETRGPQFTEAFVITFFGSCVVTLNIKLLGGKISFFQSLCVLGYCLLPCAVALIICKVILWTTTPSTLFFVIRLLITIFGFSWATFASTAFLSGSQPPGRTALAVYPIFLFYFIISWLIISQTHYGH